MRLVLQVGHARLLELHLELRKWLVFAPLPLKIAARIENATTLAYLALGAAERPRGRAQQLKLAADKLTSCMRLLDQLFDLELLREHLHLCCQRKVKEILEELQRYDPNKRVVVVTRDEPLRLMN